MKTLITKSSDPTTVISLADVKAQSTLEHSADDTLITALMASAIDHLEYSTGMVFYDTTFDEVLPYFPGCRGSITLQGAPLKAITYLKYYDPDGTLTTMDAEDYLVMTPALSRGFICPSPDVSYWPSTQCRPDAVTIRYTSGWPSSTVPAAAKHMIRLLVVTWYEHREAEGTIQTKQLELGLERLINQLTPAGYF
jgi:uncharacterized phiE125 gp8 family phage protein